MAEVMKYSDFKEEGSESAVKAAGKYRQQGRNYVVEDGDIIFFKFNAGAGLKDAKKKWARKARNFENESRKARKLCFCFIKNDFCVRLTGKFITESEYNI